MTNKVMWVDDDQVFLDETIPLVERRVEDFEFTGIDNPEAAITEFEAHHSQYALMIVDLHMPKINGIQFCKRVWSIVPDFPIVFVSGYLAEPRWIAEIKDLDRQVEQIDKPFPLTISKKFAEITRRFTNLAQSYLKSRRRDPGIGSGISESSDTLSGNEDEHNADSSLEDQTDSDPRAIVSITPGLSAPMELDISAYDFLSLKLNQALALNKLAATYNYPWVDQYFEKHEDVDWVIIDKKPHHVILQGGNGKEPSNEEIRKLALTLNSPVFRYYRCTHIVEENAVWSHKTRTQDYYPTVTLEFKTNSTKQKIACDFDTGSSATFLSYEELERRHVFDANHGAEEIRTTKYQGKSYQYFQCQFSCGLFGCDRVHKDITLACQAVTDWDNAPFCEHYSDRLGLVGRNLLMENKLKLVLDSERRCTRLLP